MASNLQLQGLSEENTSQYTISTNPIYSRRDIEQKNRLPGRTITPIAAEGMNNCMKILDN
jgi:hypothetical protein